MALTDTQIRNAKPDPEKPFTLFDGQGLYMLVQPNGSKLWRWKLSVRRQAASHSVWTIP